MICLTRLRTTSHPRHYNTSEKDYYCVLVEGKLLELIRTTFASAQDLPPEGVR